MSATFPLGGGVEEPASAKLDPVTLELRGKPPRPIRFRRGVLIGASATAAAVLAGTTWMALAPPRVQPAPEEDIRLAKATPDALRGLPADYSGVPKLGPPLPGDLGRPILERQRQLANEGGGGTGADKSQVRQQRLEAIKAARQSGLMFKTLGGADVPLSADAPPPPATFANPPTIDVSHDPAAQAHKIAFAAAMDDQPEVNPHRLAPPASPYMLSAGSIIPASLITGLRSDLPGLVAAQVTENVYDSATGQILLVPQGARLIGSYDSVIAFGQRRALVVWQRIVMPDGNTVRLDNEPATDLGGYSGVADKVDFHTWTLLKGVAISTLLGAGTNVSLTGGGDLVQAIRQSAQQNAANAGNQITAHNLDIQPTITVRPGFRIRLLVHRDLVLEPWRN